MIDIDGSIGEGGGQIVRSALGLSLATGQPVRVRNIRAGRTKPGLLRQHLTAVRAAIEVSGAGATGVEMGSRELTFAPGTVRAGEYRFAVGTAGSATLVLQTVLPALLLAPGPSRIALEGGTHNPFAPPFDFLQRALLPLIERMGPRVTATLERPGFYPAGGGLFTVAIDPVPRLAPLQLDDRGEIVGRLARARVANLDRRIAARELAVVEKTMSWPQHAMKVEVLREAVGPGNVITLEFECEHVTEIFTGFGRREATAETVAADVVLEAREWLAAGVPVGPHLADQLLVPLALAGGGRFATVAPTRHTLTNIEVIRAFLPIRADVARGEGTRWTIALEAGR